jgi:signal transduction histidine kinase
MVMAVVLAAVAAVGWTSRRGTRAEFGLFVNRLETEVDKTSEGTAVFRGDVEGLAGALQASFRSRGDWTGAGAVFAEALGTLDGRTALVVVADRVVAASDAGLAEAEVRALDDGGIEISGWERTFDADDARGVVADARTIAFRGPTRSILDDVGNEAGVLHLMPAIPLETVPHIIQAADREEFLWSVDRWILGAVVGVGLLALLAAVVLSGRIVGPIEELTEASRRMGGGDLAHRVAVRSSDEIGELASAFNTMASSLERNEELRRNMVTDVAHELRTPLTNLRGQLEAVQDGLARPSADLITSLHEEVMLLNHLVDDLQELALAEAGQLRLRPEAIDVGAEIGRAVEFFRARRDATHAGPDGAEAAAGAGILVDVETELPPALADLQRFRQVLRNLLQNAVDHGDGEIVVAARHAAHPPAVASVSRRAASAVASPAGYVVVTVADSGPGIDAHQVANIFERFYRTDPSRQRSTGGAGLGLAIVRQLVEAQGGCVWADSEPGRGAVFGFCFPAER